VERARQRAAASVNRELVTLYWQIGHDILERQQRQGWGAAVVDQLARDLKAAFPDMRGFSPRNLKYMRALAQAWPGPDFVQQPAAQLPRVSRHYYDLHQLMQPAAEGGWYADLELAADCAQHARLFFGSTDLGLEAARPKLYSHILYFSIYCVCVNCNRVMKPAHPTIDLAMMQAAATNACSLLKVLANPDRLLLMCQLSQEELSVGQLEELLGIRQPTLSQQLGVLREKGLVATRRDGKNIFYSVSSPRALAVMTVLYKQFCATR
jgi:DNA-binding transcriptional ArsR family regulator